MKCEYCIVAHTAMAKKAGATQEEIKTAIMIAGVVSLNRLFNEVLKEICKITKKSGVKCLNNLRRLKLELFVS